MADKIKFYDTYSAVPLQSDCNILWLGATTYDNYNISAILDYSKMICFPDYSNEKLLIKFDKIIDIKGKEYNNVTLVTTINDWIDGFYDLQVKTKIVFNGVACEEIIISYKDNASLTNKIMANCEKFVLTDYCIIPTLDTYNSLIISENIIFNYDVVRHNVKIDFRFITYK